jgi:hypothetical protein
MLRFTDTCKWEKHWFRKLDPDAKLLWMFLLDKVDHCGVWEIDGELFTFMSGVDFDLKRNTSSIYQLLEHLYPSVVLIAQGKKCLVPKFIKFQCRGKLNPEHAPHKAVFKALEKHGLELGQDSIPCWAIDDLPQTLLEGLDEPLGIDKEKDKDKEKEKDIWKNEDVRKLWNSICKSRPKCMSISVSRSRAIKTRAAGEDNPLHAFEVVFKAVEESDFLSGRSKVWDGACFDWVLKQSNWVKIQEGNYSNAKPKRTEKTNEEW